jgi:predicted acyl esterase
MIKLLGRDLHAKKLKRLSAQSFLISVTLILLVVLAVSPTLKADSSYVDDGRYDYGLSQPTGYGVKVECNVEITMRDGVKLRGDVYRPDGPGTYPVIMASAPYWRYWRVFWGVDDNGGVGWKYWNFEQANPEYWVPRGYIYISFNSRGFWDSEGRTSVLDYQEIVDYYDAIEWAAVQPWSNGNIGLYGISYYALSQYGVAGLHPPHLKAIVPWEGLADFYRDLVYRGGIPCAYSLLIGLGLHIISNNFFNTSNYLGLVLYHSLYDDLWEYGIESPSRLKGSTPSFLDLLSEIDVPMLSVGKLNDPDMHLRGNVKAFEAARSPNKKLLLYSGTQWGSSFQPWANRTVLRFFDHYLKGIDTGIEGEPAVDVELRTGPETFTHVYSDTWPLEQTEWTNYYLDVKDKTLSMHEPKREGVAEAQRNVDDYGISDQVTLLTKPLKRDVQVAGPLSAHLWVSSETKDVDLTVEIRDFDEEGNETRFAYYVAGSLDEPVTRGWLRASLRALDPERTLPHEPFYLFDHHDWLTPGVPVPLDVEIWPTSMVFEAGHRIAMTIHCGPYERKGEVIINGEIIPFFPKLTYRVPVYQSISPDPGTTKIYSGGKYSSWLELPIIPADPTPTNRITIQDGKFTPAFVNGRMGDRFEWTNEGDDYHSITEQSGLGLWESQLVNGIRSHNPETWWIKIPWAGTFNCRDEVCGFSGVISIPDRVARSVPAGNPVKVEIAVEPPPNGIGFDVQLQASDGTWSNIYEGIYDTQITLAQLPPGDYAVRSRMRRLDDTNPAACTDWSQPAAFLVE